MQFELLYKELGEYGCLQRWVVWVCSSTSYWAGLLILTSYFVLVIPNHRCAIPGLENDTYAIQNEYHDAIVNMTIPASKDDEDFPYDQCHYYNIDELGNKTLQECSAWVYDKSVFQTSLAADLNMVCSDTIMKSNAQMVNFLGILIGSFVTGVVSDKIGRKTTMVSSLSLIFIASLAMAWTPNYIVFVVLTFLVGFFNVGHWMPAYVLRMEFVGPSERKFAGYLSSVLFAIGNMSLAGLAYGIRDWHILLIVTASAGVVYFPLWLKRVFPESVRWLNNRGKNEQAKSILRMWGRWNNVQLSENFCEKVMTDDEDDSTQVQGNIWDLFTTKTLAFRTTVIFFIWLFVCCGYYGLAFNAADLGTDLYLNFILLAGVELPAYVICVYLLDRVGRKPIMVGSMIIGGAALVGTTFTLLYLPDQPIYTTILALVGKMGLAGGFATIYVFSAELFPTVVRNAAMGGSSSMARVGGMIAPYIADLDRLVGGSFGKALPQVVFAVLTILGGLASIFLPETLNRDLPETIDEARLFGSKQQEKKSTENQVYTNQVISMDPDELKK
ncbi:hypothetical protein ACF0H5_016699 [Mactra antiquata]